MNRPRPVCALAAGLLFFLAAARGQSSLLAPNTTSSVSGQFIVSTAPDSNPYFHRADAGTNAELLRLEPSLLAVSAERFKAALRAQLGLAADAPWNGKIFLVLRPAHSPDEAVFITPQPFIRNWNYRLEVPDVISRNRCARALGAVLLLELANRSTPVNGRAAVPPDWLVDGLAREILQHDKGETLLTAPAKNVDAVAVTQSGPTMIPGGMALARLNHDQRGLDDLAATRNVLQNFPALTFEQMSWPSGAQLDGADGGVYLASAQLFVHDLLALKNGPAKVCALLAELPAHENWQSAFFAAFREDFRRPLDVEKWWSLRVVRFAMRAPGPRWTPAVSRDRLDAALAVPVNVRYSSNALPAYAEISLQAVLQNFSPDRQVEIFQTRLRDLDLIQLRLTPELAPVADGYRQVLADFLGERKKTARHRPAGTAATAKQLDALDARRREVESNLKLSALPEDLNLNAP
jgi:hypothetical protein